MKRMAFGIAGLLALLSIALFSSTPVVAAGVSSLKLSSTSTTAGKIVVGTVKLDAKAPAEGVTVALESSNTSLATVPSSVKVKSGSNTATFSIKTKGTVESATVTISAEADAVEKTAELTVNPAKLSSVTLSKSVTGGNTLTGTLLLNGVAGPDGVVIALESNSAAATVPASVTVSSGKNSATFKVTTKPVTEATSATIWTV